MEFPAQSTSTRQDEEESDSPTCAQGNALREHPKRSGHPPLRHGSQAEPDAPRNKSQPEPVSGGRVPPHRSVRARSAREPTPLRAKQVPAQQTHSRPEAAEPSGSQFPENASEYENGKATSHGTRGPPPAPPDRSVRGIRRRVQLLRDRVESALRNCSGKNKCGCMHTLRNG